MLQQENHLPLQDHEVVYLIHFDTPYKHAKHYLGTTTNLERRMGQHRDGTGARLMQVVTNAGIAWRVARTWPGGSRTRDATEGLE